MSENQNENSKGQAGVCPICGRPVERENKSLPFCTDRCRLVDLGKWFGEGYRISRPVEQRDLDEGGA